MDERFERRDVATQRAAITPLLPDDWRFSLRESVESSAAAAT